MTWGLGQMHYPRVAVSPRGDVTPAHGRGVGARALRDIGRLLRENPRLIECAPVWRQAWTEHLAHGLAARESREEFRPRVPRSSAMALQLIAVAVGQWLYTRPDGGLVALSREVADIGQRHFGRGP